MARSKGIAIPITGINAPLRKSLKEAQKDLTAFGKAQNAWSKASTLGYAAAGSAAAQFAISTVKAALEDQRSQALLAKQLTATTGARQAQIGAVEAYISKTQLATNVTDDELRPALAQLVRVTKNTAEAQKILTLATDVSVGSGRELSSVVMALGKAYNGNYTALNKLGISFDKGALSAGGFSAVMSELSNQFGGSAATAAGTLDGQIRNLNIRWGELKETLGTKILPIVADVVGSLSDLAKAIDEVNVAKIGTSLFDLGTVLNSLTNPFVAVGKRVVDYVKSIDFSASETDVLAAKLEALSGILVADAAAWKLNKQNIEDQTEAAARNERQIGYVRDLYEQLSKVTLQQVEDQKKAKEAAASAAKTAASEAASRKKAYAETAATLRERLGDALKDARKNLQDAKDAADEFGRSLANSFGVSLSDAYSAAKEGEDAYTAALNGRKEAYAALDVAKQGNDLNAYLKAVQDVATAEQAVTDAQKARVTPAAAFQKQIEDAKNFGSNLKTLIGQGLGQSGLQQLLDLGPTAGAEVTKALLDGTAGFTVTDLNASLQGLADVQSGLAASITSQLAPKGAINSAQSMVDALSSAAIGAPGVGQGFTINITAGVGDPVEIGRQVKQVLSDYDNRAGSLIVQGGKKKGKR